MSIIEFPQQRDDDSAVVLRVKLSQATFIRLMRLADECEYSAEDVAGAMLHDILLDDELAHSELAYPVPANLN